MDNSFVEGIEPGGLREKSEIKLLICYLLKHIEQPLTKTRLNEILQEHALANYFETNQAISELLKSGKIKSEFKDDDEILYLDPAIAFSVTPIEQSIPYSVREKALASAVKMFARDRSESETDIDISRTEKGYDVTFTITDGDVQLIKLSVFAADEQQAQTVKNNFLEDPAGIYSRIMAPLIIE